MRDRAEFAQQLIQALQDAQAAAARPRSAEELARRAFDKLHFDFPVRGVGGGARIGGWRLVLRASGAA